MSPRRLCGAAAASALFAAVFMAASCEAWEQADRWGRREGTQYSETTLVKIRENPFVYLGKNVVFEGFYAGRGELYRPFFTPFTSDDYINVRTWSLDSRLWQQDERRDAFLLLYLKREKTGEIDFLEKLPLYRAVKVYAKVSSVHQKMPWIEIEHIEASSQRSYTEKGLKHIELAFNRVAALDYELAVRSFEVALKEGLPYAAEAAVNRELGIGYFKLGKFPEAEQALMNAVAATQKNDIELFLRLGQTFLKLGKYQEAAEQIENVIDFEPGLAEAHASLGLAYANLQEFDRGLRANRDALKLSPQYAPAHRNVGVIFAMMKDYNEAAEAYNRAILIEASNVDYHRELGDLYMVMKEYAKAEGRYEVVTTLNPTDALGYVLKARSVLAQDRLKDAIADYEKAMAKGPTLAIAFQGAADAYVKAGDYAKATAALEHLMELTPKDAAAVAQLADVYRRQRMLDKCVETYRKAVELDPKLVDGWVNLGKLLPNLPGKADLAGGIQAMEEALKLDPNNTVALYYLGVYYDQKGDFVQASKKLELCAKVEPENYAARELLGVMYGKLAQDRRAIAEFRAVKDAATDRLYAKARLAYMLALSGSKEALVEARDLAEEAVKGSPDNPDFNDVYGYVLFWLGDYVKGRPFAAKALAAGETPERLFHVALYDIKAAQYDAASDKLTKARDLCARTGGDQMLERLKKDVNTLILEVKRRRKTAPEAAAESSPGIEK